MLVKPQTKASLWVRTGQTYGAENDTEDGQSHVVVRAAGHRARRSQHAPRASASDVKLSKEFLDFLGYVRDQGPSGRAVAEYRVLPKMAGHFQNVRLTTSIEAADPGTLLARAADVVEKRS